MKVTLFLLALLLFTGCDDRKDKKDVADEKMEKEDNNKVEKEDNTVRVPDNEPDTYIAFKDDQGKTIYLTDSDEDVDRLIVEVALLERPYWREQRCRKMSARKCVQGDCVAGNCSLVEVGGWNVCRCQ